MKTRILFILSLFAGLMFINAGLNKFFNYMPVPEDMPEQAVSMFNAMMQIGWLIPLIGATEILGGLLLIIPGYRALGAVILAPVLAGILITHLTLGEGLFIPLLLAAIWVWVVYENRSRYAPLFKKAI